MELWPDFRGLERRRPLYSDPFLTSLSITPESIPLCQTYIPSAADTGFILSACSAAVGSQVHPSTLLLQFPQTSASAWADLCGLRAVSALLPPATLAC